MWEVAGGVIFGGLGLFFIMFFLYCLVGDD